MKREKGITLIALVITIIVLLILAGVSIATLTGENGILTKANDAKSQTEVGHLKEMVQTDILGYQTENNSEKVTSKQLRDVLDKYFKNVPEKAEDLEKNLEDPDYSLEAKAEYGKDVKLKVSDLYKGIVTENPSSSDGPTIKVGEKTVILNKDNIKDYLGKVVTNFKDDYEDKEEVVHIGDTDYTV